MRAIALLGALAAVALVGWAGGQTAEENEALETIRTIHNAQTSYVHAYPAIGYACDLAKFAVPRNGIPTSEHAGLLEEDVIRGQRGSYSFIVFCGELTTPQKSYRAAAVPSAKGAHAFCVDESGVLRGAADGKPTTCFSEGKVLK